jgi:uncharacterized membrane protein
VTDSIKYWTTQLAALVEATGAVIIALAALEAAARAALVFARRSLPPEAKEEVRLRLGMWLGVALEFELAADILRTAIAPTWNDVGLLAAIIALRTLLNFFLQMEIDRARSRDVKVPEHFAPQMGWPRLRPAARQPRAADSHTDR